MDMAKPFKDATIEECVARAAELGAAMRPEERPMWMCSAPELIQELGNRAAAMVLGVQLPDDKNTVDTWTVYAGNSASCVGLADRVLCDARMRMAEKVRIADNDEGMTEVDEDCPMGGSGDGDDDEDDDTTPV